MPEVHHQTLLSHMRDLGRVEPGDALHPNDLKSMYHGWSKSNRGSGQFNSTNYGIYITQEDYNILIEAVSKAQKEAKTMADSKETKPAEKPQLLMDLLGAAKLGAKIGVANEAGDAVLAGVTAAFPHLEPHFVDPTGRAIGKLLAAVAIAHLAHATDFEDRDKVAIVCGYVVTGAVEEITEDKLKALRPLFSKLALLAKSLPDASKAVDAPAA